MGIVYTASNGHDRDRFNFCFTVELTNASNLNISIPNNEISEYCWVDFNQVAAMSNNRASYIKFQSLLINRKPLPVYIEIHPS